MNNFKNIKKILKTQIEKNTHVFWTFDEDKMEFTQIYKNYNNGLTIYTPSQLFNHIIDYAKTRQDI